MASGMAGSEIAHRRLYNQRISGAPLENPGDVVDWLGAVQAQDYAGAKWALGLRMQRATDDEIDRAFAAGSILRTHLLRPTWHFVSPSDIRWMQALTGPRVHAANAGIYRRLELDRATLKRSRRVMEKALSAGRPLTRDELREALERAGIAVGSGLRLAFVVMAAELDAVICSGPRRGKQFTYALVDQRAPEAKPLDHEAALAELARRYLRSRGPATVHDFARWSGLTVADAQRGLNALQPEAIHETAGDLEYWLVPSAWPRKTKTPAAYLLSFYDEYISGYQDRSAICAPEVWAALMADAFGLFYVILLDGQIVGTWKRILEKNRVVCKTHLSVRMTPAQDRALAAAAERYGEFLGLPAILT